MAAEEKMVVTAKADVGKPSSGKKTGDSALLRELELMYCFGSSCISVCRCNVKLGLNAMVASASWFGKSRPR